MHTGILTNIQRKIDLTSSKVDLVLAQLSQMNHAGKPGMTQVEFAKLINRTPRTVARMIKDGRIRLRKGVIPQEEIRKFLS